MQVSQGNLTMIGLNTPTPQVFWNGHQVGGITKVNIEWTDKEQEVNLIVNGDDYETYTALASAGVTIKKEQRHV